jgi:hypothetical protein
MPPIFFVPLLSFLCILPKLHLLETLKVLQHLLTSELHRSIPGFSLVIEASLVPLPLVVLWQKTMMSHVAMF